MNAFGKSEHGEPKEPGGEGSKDDIDASKTKPLKLDVLGIPTANAAEQIEQQLGSAAAIKNPMLGPPAPQRRPRLSDVPELGQTFYYDGNDYKIAEVACRNTNGDITMVIRIPRRSGAGFRVVPLKDIERMRGRPEVWALKVVKKLTDYPLEKI